MGYAECAGVGAVYVYKAVMGFFTGAERGEKGGGHSRAVLGDSFAFCDRGGLTSSTAGKLVGNPELCLC